MMLEPDKCLLAGTAHDNVVATIVVEISNGRLPLSFAQLFVCETGCTVSRMLQASASNKPKAKDQ